jgi:uncharacterized protein
MKLKLSYYTIFTEIDCDTTILYSSRSGQSIAVQTVYWNSINELDFEKLPFELIKKLIEFQLLVPDDENELESVINENKSDIEENSTLYQVVQPSANCQLGCGYCGQKHTKDQLAPESYDYLVDRLESKITTNKKIKHLKIGWFGSEPLMGLSSIRSLTDKFKNLAEKHDIKYSAKMTTNGLALKSKIFLDLVQLYDVKNFEITLDGTPEFHDKRRFVKSGEKSFEIIFNNLVNIFDIENFDDLGVNISIRCNVDKSNYEGVVPLIELMAENKFQDKISGFYVAPIHSWGNEAHLVSLEKEEFAQKEIDWLIASFKNGFTPSLLPVRSKNVCMVVDKKSELLDAFGNIYNCTEVPYVPAYENSEYLLGNINTTAPDKQFEKLPLSDWNDLILNKDKRFQCSDCKMLPVCGGACPKSWHEGMIPCPSPKHNIQDRLALSYLISQNGVEIFNEINQA